MQQTQPANPIANLNTISAAYVNISITVSEMVLAFGVTQVKMQNVDGNIGPVIMAQWPLAVSLPAPVAKSLSEGLNTAIEQYEKTFGKIPSDPNAHFSVKPKT